MAFHWSVWLITDDNYITYTSQLIKNTYTPSGNYIKFYFLIYILKTIESIKFVTERKFSLNILNFLTQCQYFLFIQQISMQIFHIIWKDIFHHVEYITFSNKVLLLIMAFVGEKSISLTTFWNKIILQLLNIKLKICRFHFICRFCLQPISIIMDSLFIA